jgi:SPP1 family predicted phage head-tail adaptor
MSVIGTFRHTLTLQQESRAADTGGGVVLTWVNLRDVWARVEPISGRETIQAGNVVGVVTHRITTRYDSAIAPSLRFAWGARVLNIRSVKNVDAHNRFMVIMAEEGVAT